MFCQNIHLRVASRSAIRAVTRGATQHEDHRTGEDQPREGVFQSRNELNHGYAYSAQPLVRAATGTLDTFAEERLFERAVECAPNWEHAHGLRACALFFSEDSGCDRHAPLAKANRVLEGAEET